MGETMKKTALVTALLLAFATFGCTSADECTRAADKLADCGLPNDGVAAGGCSGTSLCEANCINDYSCDEIRTALGGTPNAYSACDDACR
jgi:hypothetical protein